ncbi:MAG: ABC transporter ATP-binding protein [Nitrososphaerales archaeon]
MPDNLLKLSDLTVQYRLDNSTVTALDDVSLTIPGRNYSLGVIGESGSGKTTLGLCMMGAIEQPGKVVSGSVEYQGKNVLKQNSEQLRKYRWEEVSMVYQSAMNSLNPVKKSVDHIAEVIREHQGSVSKGEAHGRAIKLLASMGLKQQQADSYAHELSGGMRQRVVIAMALALSPKILIADEPTSALDVVTQKQILALLRREMIRNNLSLIFITHEISLLSGLVEDVMVMYSGEIFEKGPIDKVLFEPLHPYTEMLLGTLLTFDSKLPSTPFSQGAEVMLQRSSTNGNYCKYAGRCKYTFDRCFKEKPLLKEASPGRWTACHKYN